MDNFVIVPSIGFLAVSRDGRVLNMRTGKLLSTRPNKAIGYVLIKTSVEGRRFYFYLHRLLGEVFLKVPDNMNIADLEINHKDSDRANNDLDNLEWVTGSENINHAQEFGMKNDCVSSVIKNITTGEEIKFISLSQLASFLGLALLQVLRSLNGSKAGKQNRRGFIFKRDDGSPWPECDISQIQVDTWAFKLRYQSFTTSGVLTDFFSRAEVARYYGVKEATLPLSGDFYIGTDLLTASLVNVEIDGTSKAIGRNSYSKKSIKVSNTKLDTVTIFDTLRSAAKHVKMKVGTLSRRLLFNKMTIINEFIVETA